MQATVRAKGHKPSRSGLLTVLLVLAVGLALGALAWNVFEDDDTGGGSQSVVQAPITDGPNSLTRDEVTDTGLMTVAEPGEPNSISRDDVIDTGQASVAVPVDLGRIGGWAADTANAPVAAAVDLSRIGGWAADAANAPIVYTSDYAGEGVLGGFTVIEPEPPTAFHQDGMGEGWLGTGKMVDEGVAQNPVAPPGIGYFA